MPRPILAGMSNRCKCRRIRLSNFSISEYSEHEIKDFVMRNIEWSALDFTLTFDFRCSPILRIVKVMQTAFEKRSSAVRSGIVTTGIVCSFVKVMNRLDITDTSREITRLQWSCCRDAAGADELLRWLPVGQRHLCSKCRENWPTDKLRRLWYTAPQHYLSR